MFNIFKKCFCSEERKEFYGTILPNDDKIRLTFEQSLEIGNTFPFVRKFVYILADKIRDGHFKKSYRYSSSCIEMKIRGIKTEIFYSCEDTGYISLYICDNSIKLDDEENEIISHAIQYFVKKIDMDDKIKQQERSDDAVKRLRKAFEEEELLEKCGSAEND